MLVSISMSTAVVNYGCVRRFSGEGTGGWDGCNVAAECTKAANGAPCLNGGGVTGITGDCGCSCVTGFSGPNCETAAACTTGDNGFPCQNNGVATGTTGRCGCGCAAGFSGANCQAANACTSGANGATCANGGTATGVTGNCGCRCAAGFSGNNCETVMLCSVGANGASGMGPRGNHAVEDPLGGRPMLWKTHLVDDPRMRWIAQCGTWLVCGSVLSFCDSETTSAKVV
jgi:hypothetical protein